MEITDQNYKELIATGRPVVVDFWATWCGPCRMIAPLVEELAQEYDGRVVIGKCNVDDNEEMPGEFGVRNIPTLLFFKGGQLVDKSVGAVPKATLKEKIDALL